MFAPALRRVMWVDLHAAVQSSTAKTAATQLATVGATLISSIVLARVLGAAGRGDVAAVMTTLTLLSWVVFLGLPNAAGYLSQRGRSSSVSLAALMSLGLGLTAGALVWLAAPSFLAGHDPDTVTGLRVAAVLLPVIGLGMCGLEICYAEHRVVLWNVLRSVPLLGPSIGILLLASLDRLTVGSVLVIHLGSTVVCSVASVVLVVARCGPGPWWAAKRTVLSYALPRWSSASSDAVTARLDQVMLVALSTPAELGRYVVVVSAVSAANPLSSAIGMMLYPRARNADNSDEAQRFFSTARRRALLISVSIGVALAVGGPWLIPSLFGPDFTGVGGLIALLVAAQVLSDQWNVNVSYYGGTGQPRVVVAPAWIGAGTTAVGLLLLGVNGLTAVEAAAMTLLGTVIRATTLWLKTRAARNTHAPVTVHPEGVSGG